MGAVKRAQVAQVWIELLGDDPEAVSALAVAKARLPAARGLDRLRRQRLIEIKGTLPARTTIEQRLQESTQFFNPHKERCLLRRSSRDPAPLATDEVGVLVWERGGARRPAAERWWLHETGELVEVREGAAWLLAFDPSEDGPSCTQDLVRVINPRHGLLCNPFAQNDAVAWGQIPIPWIKDPTRTSRRKR